MTSPDHLTDPVSQAVKREAASIAEHTGIGVSALSRANYAQDAYYLQAFFALSVGFEQGCKLAIVIHHAQKNSGHFMSTNTLKAFGHDLKALLKSTVAVAVELGLSPVPDTNIHQAIIEVLTLFAMNKTRYFNLDFLTSRPGNEKQREPIRHWYEAVIEPVLAAHYTEVRRDRDLARALFLDEMTRSFVLVRHTSEQGESLTSVRDAAIASMRSDFAKPYTRLAVLQIARFLAQIYNELANRSYTDKNPFVPDLSEFFALYNNDDSYLKRRKTWSLYPTSRSA